MATYHSMSASCTGVVRQAGTSDALSWSSTVLSSRCALLWNRADVTWNGMEGGMEWKVEWNGMEWNGDTSQHDDAVGDERPCVDMEAMMAALSNTPS